MKEKETAYDRIKKWILTEPVKPGTRMVEQAIAEKFSLSRAPIRDAFQRLYHEGLLVKTGNKGLELRSYTEQSLVDIFTFREYLDGMAARLFALRAEEVEIKYLGMILKDLEDLKAGFDQKVQWQKDFEFHMAITRGARNERILLPHRNVLQECLYIAQIQYSSMTRDDPRIQLDMIIGEHRRIAGAVSSRDADLAEKTARESVRAGVERAMRSMLKWNE